MKNTPAIRGNSAIFGNFAQSYGIDPADVSRILKSTAFKVADKNNPNLEATDEQMVALLIVADKYRLNPFIREIYAFVDTHGKGITPVIPVDGWARIANEHPQYDGVEFHDAEKTVRVGNKEVPEWIEATIHRKDRSHPTTIREYFNECSRGSGPWGSHPARMLRHKAFIQAARIALGFGGVYDEDEGERIASARLVEMKSDMPASIDITPEAKALPTGEEFEGIILQAGFGDQRDKVEAYLHVCAQHFQSSIDEVKAEAVRHPDNFIKTFPAWLKSAEQHKNGQASAASKPQDAMEEERTFPCPRKDNAPVDDEDCFHCPEREGCPSHA